MNAVGEENDGRREINIETAETRLTVKGNEGELQFVETNGKEAATDRNELETENVSQAVEEEEIKAKEATAREASDGGRASIEQCRVTEPDVGSDLAKLNNSEVTVEKIGDFVSAKEKTITHLNHEDGDRDMAQNKTVDSGNQEENDSVSGT